MAVGFPADVAGTSDFANEVVALDLCLTIRCRRCVYATFERADSEAPRLRGFAGTFVAYCSDA